MLNIFANLDKVLNSGLAWLRSIREITAVEIPDASETSDMVNPRDFLSARNMEKS